MRCANDHERMFRLRECHCASALARLRPWNCRNAHGRLGTIRLRAVRACHTGWQRWRRAVSFHVRQSAMTKCPPRRCSVPHPGPPGAPSRVPPRTGHPASTNQRSCIASESACVGLGSQVLTKTLWPAVFPQAIYRVQYHCRSCRARSARPEGRIICAEFVPGVL